MACRRATRWQGVFLAVVLVVTPVALLAQPAPRGKAKCTGMCCRPRARHVANPANAVPSPAATSDPAHDEEMSCARGVAAHLAMCMAPAKTEVDYGAIAPLPPVILSAGMPVPAPEMLREAPPRLPRISLLEFFPSPFQPPRS